MANLKYLPGIVPYTFGLYLLVIVPVYYLFVKQHHAAKSSARTTAATNAEDDLTAFQAFFVGKELPLVYDSHWFGKWGKYVLLAWRLCWFVYFFAVVFIWGSFRADFSNAHYFTWWNIYMITLFYALASFISIVGLWKDYIAVNQPAGSPPLQLPLQIIRIGYVVQIAYEFLGGTALFVTVIAFSALNPAFVYWNVNVHFLTTISFLGEMALNTLEVRLEHIAVQITWAVVYLCFIWPIVGARAVQNWPYFFLETDSPSVFAWYFILFIVDLLFYGLWYAMDRLKDFCVEKYHQPARVSRKLPKLVPASNQQLLSLTA